MMMPALCSRLEDAAWITSELTYDTPPAFYRLGSMDRPATPDCIHHGPFLRTRTVPDYYKQTYTWLAISSRRVQ